jgi:hypothetical protein
VKPDQAAKLARTWDPRQSSNGDVLSNATGDWNTVLPPAGLRNRANGPQLHTPAAKPTEISTHDQRD